MRAMFSYDYAILHLDPAVEHEKFVNAGEALPSLEHAFPDCPGHLDQRRPRAEWQSPDPDPIRQHLEVFPRIRAGDPHARPVARLSRRRRFPRPLDEICRRQVLA